MMMQIKRTILIVMNRAKKFRLVELSDLYSTVILIGE
jgi:hypothetical protein